MEKLPEVSIFNRGNNFDTLKVSISNRRIFFDTLSSQPNRFGCLVKETHIRKKIEIAGL
jgi:hypothetical protein